MGENLGRFAGLSLAEPRLGSARGTRNVDELDAQIVAPHGRIDQKDNFMTTFGQFQIGLVFDRNWTAVE